jgi:hypothetical protein
MNTSRGWVQLYRCFLEDPIWQCSTNEQKVNTLITIYNWEHYQSHPDTANQAANHPLTSRSPPANQGLTTYKNDKNIYISHHAF